MTSSLLASVLVGGLVGWGATWAVERVARQRHVLDVPNARSAHVIPTPRLGGLGIIAGSVAGWVAAGGWADTTGSLLLLVAVALGVVGFLDDLGHSSVIGKYTAQLAAAIAVVVILEPTIAVRVGDMAVDVGGPVAALLTAIGITALVNAWNFMDGIDGLIAGVTIVVGVVAVGLVEPSAVALIAPIVAATAGFMIWNHAPASIFMGDAGSQFLGLAVAATLMQGARGTVDAVPVALLVAPILFDTGLTLVRRARARQDLFAAHRDHLYQRLASASVPVRSVASGYAAGVAAFGMAALAWEGLEGWMQWATLAVGGLSLGGFTVWVSRRERARPAAVEEA